MSTLAHDAISKMANCYINALGGVRFAEYHLNTLSEREQHLLNLRKRDEKYLLLLQAILFGLLTSISIIFFWQQRTYGRDFAPVYFLLPIPVLFVFLIRHIKSNIKDGHRNSPIIIRLTEQLKDPTKAFFFLCADGLYRPQDEIMFLQRSFPHVCALYMSLRNTYNTLSSALNFEAGGVHIGVREESKFRNENFLALHYFGYELDRIQQGIIYIFGVAALPDEQDRLCSTSRLLTMCADIRKFVVGSTLIKECTVEQIFSLPKPINVLNGEYIISPQDDSFPFRALSLPIH